MFLQFERPGNAGVARPEHSPLLAMYLFVLSVRATKVCRFLLKTLIGRVSQQELLCHVEELWVRRGTRTFAEEKF